MKKGELYFIVFVVLIVSSFAQNEPFPPPGIDEEKPMVQIIVPTSGQTVSGEFVVRAKATDNVGVERVEFLLDGVAVFTDTIPTADGVYQWLWDSTKAANGQHEIIVAPYDEAGNFNDLTKVSVTVSNTGGAVVSPPTAQPASQTVPNLPVPSSQPSIPEPISQPPSFPENIPVQQPITPEPPVQQPRVAPVQPAVPQQTQSAPARGAAPVVETAEETETDAGEGKPLWLTLLTSFGLIVIAGGLLAFAFVKMRASPAVPESIKTYVSMSMQRGYPVNSIQRALQSQGWDDKVIEEAFKEAIQR